MFLPRFFNFRATSRYVFARKKQILMFGWVPLNNQINLARSCDPRGAVKGASRDL